MVFRLWLLVTFISFYRAVEAELPCSSAINIPVIDICSIWSVNQDANLQNILLKVTSEQECQCQLTIENHMLPIEIQFKRFNDLTSSSPSAYGCGVIVEFGFKNDIIYRAECIFNSFRYLVPANNTLDIRTVQINGRLNDNEGYCIEITKIDDTEQNYRLGLHCNNTYVPTTTTMNSLITGPMSTMSTDQEVSNVRYITNDTATSGDEVKVYISVGAAVIGTSFLIVIVIVLVRRLYYGKKGKKDSSQSVVHGNNNVVYDNLLHVPTSTIDNSYQHLHLQTRSQPQNTTIGIDYSSSSTTDYEVPSRNNTNYK